MVCGSDNTWNSSRVGRCVGKQCPELSGVENGRLSGTHRNVGSVVEIECDDGSVNLSH